MKIVLIGAYGHQGYVYSTVIESHDLELAAVAYSDPTDDPARILEYLAEKGVRPRVYKDMREMLDKEKPDLAGVSPMYRDHQKISVECLKRDIHVICEKPVALNLDELAELEEVHAASSATMVGMHAMRYAPEFYTAYSALKEGLIGKPIMINSQKSYAFNTTRPAFYRQREKYGGTLCWVAVHALDWTYWMMGPLDNLYAAHTTAGNRGYDSCESAGVIGFTLRDGGLGSIHFDFLKAYRDKIKQDYCRIAGESGVIEVIDGKVWIVTHEKERAELELKRPEKGFARSFIDSVQGRGSCLIDAEDTFEVTRLALELRDLADKKTR